MLGAYALCAADRQEAMLKKAISVVDLRVFEKAGISTKTLYTRHSALIM